MERSFSSSRKTSAELNGGSSALMVQVVSCAELPAKDLNGLCDPYVRIRLTKEGSHATFKAHTPVLKRTLEPRWPHPKPSKGAWRRVFVVENGHFTSYRLSLTVRDEDRLGRNDDVGSVTVELREQEALREGNLVRFSMPLQLDGATQRQAERKKLHPTIDFNLKLQDFPLGSHVQLVGALRLDHEMDAFFRELGISTIEEYSRMLGSDLERGLSNVDEERAGDDVGSLRKFVYGVNKPPCPVELKGEEEKEWKSTYKAIYSCWTRVMRDGEAKWIKNTHLLVGDVRFLYKGDFIDTDGLYLEGENFQINRHRITGETAPVVRNEEQPVVDAGSMVEKGWAKVLVTAVGRNSIFGSTYMKKHPEPSDLGLVLHDVLFRGTSNTMYERYVERLKRGGKTFLLLAEGYITTHRKTVCSGWVMGDLYTNLAKESSSAVSYAANLNMAAFGAHQHDIQRLQPESFELLRDAIVLNTKATLHEVYPGNVRAVGSQTDASLLRFLWDIWGASACNTERRNSQDVLREWAFAEGRKSVIAKVGSRTLSLVLGFAENMGGERTTHYLDHYGKRAECEGLNKVESVEAAFLKFHMKPIVIAFREVAPENAESISREEAESALTLLAVFGVKDPTHVASAQAVSVLKAQNVVPILCTNQKGSKARLGALESDILNEELGEQVASGEEWMALSVADRAKALHSLRVLYSAGGEAKKALADVIKLQGANVVYAGKGITSIPAMRVADFSVAMATASDAVKSAAHAVVLNNDIVKMALLASGSSEFEKATKGTNV